jgi:hypothetical protein
MTNGSRQPVFFERKTYRRRRMADGARVLPVVGAILFCLPLSWSSDETSSTASVMLYLFLIWVLLCLASFLFARFLADSPEPPGDAPSREAG